MTHSLDYYIQKTADRLTLPWELKTNYNEVSFDIAEIASFYCDENDQNALYALRLIKSHMKQQEVSQNNRDFIVSILDKKLPSTSISIPLWMRDLPVYPTAKHRRADEVRDMFKEEKLSLGEINAVSRDRPQNSAYLFNKNLGPAMESLEKKATKVHISF